jgi:preprotein translocase subunit SecG
MLILLIVLHVIVCLFLMIVVLLQSGKAADLAGAFGGMGSQTAFGPRGGATLLSKATEVAAVLFMVTSLSLSVMYTRAGGGVTGSSVLDEHGQSTTKSAPAPAKPAPAKQAPGKFQMQMETTGGEKGPIQDVAVPQQTPANTKKAPEAPKKQ